MALTQAPGDLSAPVRALTGISAATLAPRLNADQIVRNTAPMPGTFGNVVFDPAKPTILVTTRVMMGALIGNEGDVSNFYHELKRIMPDCNVFLFLDAHSSGVASLHSFIQREWVEVVYGPDAGFVDASFLAANRVSPVWITDFPLRYGSRNSDSYLSISLEKTGKWILPHSAQERLENVRRKIGAEGMETVKRRFLDSAPVRPRDKRWWLPPEGQMALDTEFLAHRTLGLAYPYDRYVFETYLCLLGLVIARNGAFPDGVSLVAVVREDELISRDEMATVSKLPNIAGRVNTLLSGAGAGHARIVVARPGRGDYEFFPGRGAPQILGREDLTGSDVVLIPSLAMQQSDFFEGAAIASLEPGPWRVPNFMTGTGSYTLGAALHVLTGNMAIHDGAINHLQRALSEASLSELQGFMLGGEFVDNPAARMEAFLCRMQDMRRVEDVPPFVTNAFRSNWNGEIRTGDYRRLLDQKSAAARLASDIRETTNARALSLAA